jgi:hypothetical protein
MQHILLKYLPDSTPSNPRAEYISFPADMRSSDVTQCELIAVGGNPVGCSEVGRPAPAVLIHYCAPIY